MFLGQYVGVPNAWDWRQIPGEVGTFCQESTISIGSAIYFIARDDFYVFDGARITPLESPLRKTFYDDLDMTYRTRIFSALDRNEALIYWFYPSVTGGGSVNKCIVYNYKINKWGRADTVAEIAVEHVAPGVTYDGLGSSYSTYDDLPTSIAYDSSYWTTGDYVVSFFNSSHKMCSFGGTPTTSSITTGHYGDASTFSTVGSMSKLTMLIFCSILSQ